MLAPALSDERGAPSGTRVVAEPRASVVSPVMRTVSRNDRYRLARRVQATLPPGCVRRRRRERGDRAREQQRSGDAGTQSHFRRYRRRLAEASESARALAPTVESRASPRSAIAAGRSSNHDASGSLSVAVCFAGQSCGPIASMDMISGVGVGASRATIRVVMDAKRGEQADGDWADQP
jgi:hypothetical protein